MNTRKKRGTALSARVSSKPYHYLNSLIETASLTALTALTEAHASLARASVVWCKNEVKMRRRMELRPLKQTCCRQSLGLQTLSRSANTPLLPPSQKRFVKRSERRSESGGSGERRCLRHLRLEFSARKAGVKKRMGISDEPSRIRSFSDWSRNLVRLATF